MVPVRSQFRDKCIERSLNTLRVAHRACHELPDGVAYPLPVSEQELDWSPFCFSVMLPSCS